jgi:hypothetical protein
MGGIKEATNLATIIKTMMISWIAMRLLSNLIILKSVLIPQVVTKIGINTSRVKELNLLTMAYPKGSPSGIAKPSMKGSKSEPWPIKSERYLEPKTISKMVWMYVSLTCLPSSVCLITQNIAGRIANARMRQKMMTDPKLIVASILPWLLLIIIESTPMLIMMLKILLTNAADRANRPSSEFRIFRSSRRQARIENEVI